uniref:Uncharacterized protein n=1 Tax=Anguilla anguilla TaxID=7936 RepID=A0A0E9XLY6_ANGAN
MLALPLPPFRGTLSIRLMYCHLSGISPQFPHLSFKNQRKSSPTGCKFVIFSSVALNCNPNF